MRRHRPVNPDYPSMNGHPYPPRPIRFVDFGSNYYPPQPPMMNSPANGYSPPRRLLDLRFHDAGHSGHSPDLRHNSTYIPTHEIRSPLYRRPIFMDPMAPSASSMPWANDFQSRPQTLLENPILPPTASTSSTPSITPRFVMDYAHGDHREINAAIQSGSGMNNYGHGFEPRMQSHFTSPPDVMRRNGTNVTRLFPPPRSAQELPADCDQNLNYYDAGEEFYYRLALDAMNQYDKSYEQSIWDYDPKFTWDYLPGTSRGSKQPKEFVCGKDYHDEETKWKKHRRTTERIYSHEIAERKAKLERGESLYDDSDNPVSVRPPEAVDKSGVVYERFVAEVGFPEDVVKADYCGLCRIALRSVIASVSHYEGQQHEKNVRQHFVQGLLRLGEINSAAQIPDWIEIGVIKRGLNKFRSRPVEWMCDLCMVSITSLEMAETHFAGSTHRKKVNALQVH